MKPDRYPLCLRLLIIFSPVKHHCNCASNNRVALWCQSSTLVLTAHRKNLNSAPTNILAPLLLSMSEIFQSNHI